MEQKNELNGGENNRTFQIDEWMHIQNRCEPINTNCGIGSSPNSFICSGIL